MTSASPERPPRSPGSTSRRAGVQGVSKLTRTVRVRASPRSVGSRMGAVASGAPPAALRPAVRHLVPQRGEAVVLRPHGQVCIQRPDEPSRHGLRVEQRPPRVVGVQREAHEVPRFRHLTPVEAALRDALRRAVPAPGPSPAAPSGAGGADGWMRRPGARIPSERPEARTRSTGTTQTRVPRRCRSSVRSARATSALPRGSVRLTSKDRGSPSAGLGGPPRSGPTLRAWRGCARGGSSPCPPRRRGSGRSPCSCSGEELGEDLLLPGAERFGR